LTVASAAPKYDPRAVEDQVMSIIGEAIRRREVCPTSEEIAFQLDIGLSTVPTILRRLEARGLIRRQIFQRTRQVTIVSTGRSTAMPTNTAPHWRQRPPGVRVPTPALGVLRSRDPEATARIMVLARRRGAELHVYLADLVWNGLAMAEAAELAEG
jgi:DNA-binding transcriptional MocR family regulator